jgi:hypothetical protein
LPSIKVMIEFGRQTFDLLDSEARERGFTIQELMRAVIIPDWFRTHGEPKSLTTHAGHFSMSKDIDVPWESEQETGIPQLRYGVWWGIGQMTVRTMLSKVSFRDIGYGLSLRVDTERLGPTDNPNVWRYKLRLFPTDKKRFQRAGLRFTKKGKRTRVNAVCAHGNYRFARALFYADPDATIATKVGLVIRDNLEDAYKDNFYRNVSSPMDPLFYGEACFCPYSDQDTEATPDPNDPTIGKWYWHIHHRALVERLIEPLQNRIDYIKQHESAERTETHLRVLKPVRNSELLDRLIDSMTGETEHDAPIELRVDALHAEECPNCPWDPYIHSIFPLPFVSPTETVI